MDLVWPVAAWALWVAMLAAAFKVSSRHDPGQGADAAPPAPVADLLRGMRAQEVFHTALFELAGRGWVAVEGDHLSLGSPMEEPLPAYERWVLERVRARMGNASEAAVIDLMPTAAELDRAFVPLVRRHAIELGLARRRWPSLLVPVVLAASLVVPWYVTVAAAGVSWPGIIATAVSFVAGIGLLMGGRGFVPTARGREAAEAGPAGPEQEWIFTGSGWHSGEIEPARPLPQRQEVTGHIVKRWADTGRYYIALHDGSSPKATAFEVQQGLYHDVLPGDCVRVLVRPRSGTVVRVLAHDRHW
ncbi:hypothetical protein [Nonomuraea sp. NPDC050202]|jgi:hypothetical protein|uniref:hypothetical protein n=1 Tax=Nonomuraea sp. NPDC050202 TaxID=3155035 RepID=UPI0033E3B686